MSFPAECQHLSCLFSTGYHKHSKDTDSSELVVSLDIVGRLDLNILYFIVCGGVTFKRKLV